MHRAHFLDDLIKSVPSRRAHFNKRVDSLNDEQDGPVVIHFKDGTTATADAVIGADGVHSTVRAHLLGKEAAKPVFAGSVAYRALVPMDKAVEKLGEEFAENSFFMCGRGKLPVLIVVPLPALVLDGDSQTNIMKAEVQSAIPSTADPS